MLQGLGTTVMVVTQLFCFLNVHTQFVNGIDFLELLNILYIYNINSNYGNGGEPGVDIIISNASGKPIYEQITAQIKNLILSGELHAGDALPSIRLLAKDLRISVITTKRAYDELERDGFIETVAGKGSFVSERDTQLVQEHHFREIEGHLQAAVEIALQSAVSAEQLCEIITLLYRGE